jgi:hypothetical protein
MQSFKQFLLEARRRQGEPQVIPTFHGGNEFTGSVDTSRGPFFMSPDPQISQEYAHGEHPVSDDRTEPPDVPMVRRFDVDVSRYSYDPTHMRNFRNTQRPENVPLIRPDQAMVRAAKASKAMEYEILQGRSQTERISGKNKDTRAFAAGMGRQVNRLLSGGKGTRGQREFEGEIRVRPKHRYTGDVELVIPQFGKTNLTQTGEVIGDEPLSLPAEMNFVPQNIPQENLRRINPRPFRGVSAFRGIQLSGPNINREFGSVPEHPGFIHVTPAHY